VNTDATQHVNMQNNKILHTNTESGFDDSFLVVGSQKKSTEYTRFLEWFVKMIIKSLTTDSVLLHILAHVLERFNELTTEISPVSNASTDSVLVKHGS
jgi:hypothetical protein